MTPPESESFINTVEKAIEILEEALQSSSWTKAHGLAREALGHLKELLD